MSRETCLSDEELTLFMEGLAEPAERDLLAAHLVACEPCKERWAFAAAPSEGPLGSGHQVDIGRVAAQAARA